MTKISLTLSFEDEKLEAMEIFLKKDNSSVQKKLEDTLKKLYEEVVPEPVREYVDAKSSIKPKRPTPPYKPKSEPKPKPTPSKETTSHEQP